MASWHSREVGVLANDEIRDEIQISFKIAFLVNGTTGTTKIVSGLFWKLGQGPSLSSVGIPLDSRCWEPGFETLRRSIARTSWLGWSGWREQPRPVEVSWVWRAVSGFDGYVKISILNSAPNNREMPDRTVVMARACATSTAWRRLWLSFRPFVHRAVFFF